MQQKGKLQKELCAFLGLNQQSFTDWKSGKNKSYIKYISQISQFLNVSIGALYGEKK